jgi:hypothetical protein
MRHDLDRAPEIISAPFLGNDIVVDPAGGKVVFLTRVDVRISLVMAELMVPGSTLI